LDAAGLCHAYSGTCAIDIDNFEHARIWFATRGIDLDALFADPEAVRIQSPKDNRGKLIYALPQPMQTRQIKEDGKVILEFRCATRAGATMQDVLPPSPYPDGGHYQWVGDWQSLPPLPDELALLWGALAAPDDVERASTPTIDRTHITGLLERLDPDMPYDEWLRVGMAVHHEFGGSEEGFATWLTWSAGGGKFAGEADVRSHWDSFTPGGGITGESLKQMQQARADDFPIVPLPPPVKLEYLTPADVLAPRDLPPFLVDGLLELDSECSIIGPTGSYKSLFVFELACCVATGSPFFGRPTQKGLVVMLVGEGRGGIDRRLQALHAARHPDLLQAPLAIYPKPIALPTAENVNHIRALIADAEQRFQQKLSLLVIDTYSRYAAGDEDKTGDTYTFFRAARACRGDASLIVCHHTGHGDKSRARGSSAWGQLVDTEFVAEVIDDSAIRLFQNTKQKDSEPAAPMYFTIAEAPTMLSRQGVPVTSVILEPTIMEAPQDKLT
ncbi:MAG: AAA family ATPase, partial [Gammaproteobacteria bacterium]